MMSQLGSPLDLPGSLRAPGSPAVFKTPPGSAPPRGVAALPSSFWERLPRRSDDAATRAAKGLIERAVFHSDDYPEAERAAAYQFLIAASARMTPLAEPFRVHAVWYTLGDVRLCLFDNIPHLFERSREKLAFDKLDRLGFQYLVRGEVVADFDGSAVEVDEGSVYGIDFGRPATIRELRSVRLVLLSVPRSRAASLLSNLESVHGLVLRPDQMDDYGRRLADLVPRLETLKLGEVAGVVTDLLTTLGGCVSSASPPAIPASRPSTLRRVVLDHIETNIADRNLTPASIAQAMNISRSVLFAAFRESGGVERAIIDRRLLRAHRMLTHAGDRIPLARLSESCGFASAEHFSRLFSKRFGVAPSRFKA